MSIDDEVLDKKELDELVEALDVAETVWETNKRRKKKTKEEKKESK